MLPRVPLARGRCPRGSRQRSVERLPGSRAEDRRLRAKAGCSPGMRFRFACPTDWQTTKATASASVSRTCLVVSVRRSPRWSISWAISCTSVENSSAGCIPERSVIFPPCERPFAGAMLLGEAKLDALRFDELKQAFAESAHVALHFGQCREVLCLQSELMSYLVICGRASARSMDSACRCTSR